MAERIGVALTEILDCTHIKTCQETAGRRAANNSLHDANTRLNRVRNSFHGKELSVPLHRRVCTDSRAFVAVSVAWTHVGAKF